MRFNAKSSSTGSLQGRREERGFESGLYHTCKHTLWAVSVILTESLWTLRIDTMKPGRLCDVTVSHSSMNTLYYRNFAADSNMLTLGLLGQKIQLLGIFALSQSIPQCIWVRRWNEGRATAGWTHNPKNEDRQKYPNVHSCWALCPIIFTNEFHDQKGNVYKMWIRSAWAGQ